MKQLTLSIVILFAGYGVSSAQVFVDDVNINEQPDNHYIQVWVGTRSGKYYVQIDYGQSLRSSDEHVISTTDKKPIVFKSWVELLNFLYKNGWRVEDFSVSTVDASKTYLLSRKEPGSGKN